MLEKDEEQSTSDVKNEEPSIDQETRQSRLCLLYTSRAHETLYIISYSVLCLQKRGGGGGGGG
ncbi:hypothetical protein ACQ4LK_25360, partial [Bacillus pumilus]